MKITTLGPKEGTSKSSRGFGTLALVLLMFVGVIFGQGGLSTVYAQPTPTVTANLSGPTTANIGDNLTFTISLAVDGNLPSASVIYGVPFGTDFVSASQVTGPGSFTCTNNIGTVTCENGVTFPANQTATFNFVVHVNTDAGPGRNLYSTGQITGSYGVNQYTNDITTHIPTYTNIAIQGPSRMLPGNNVTYKLVVKNNGAYPVGLVKVFFPLSPNLTYLSADLENCTLESGVSLPVVNQGQPEPAGIYCEVDGLAAGEAKVIGLTFLANGNLGECFLNTAMITIFSNPTLKGGNQGAKSGDTASATFTTCFGENAPEPPADLVAQLRVSPDRLVTDSENTDVTYTLTVKNIGYGQAHQIQAKFPFDPSLVIGYATFDEPGAWVSEIGSDPANPYIVINFPNLDLNASASATVVLRPAADAASETTEFNRFTVKWDDAAGSGKTAGSNAVRLSLGSESVNLNNGDVQLFDPAEITIPSGQTQTFTGDFFAPNELVTGWYTDANGQSTSLGTKLADATGTVSFDFSASGHAAGEKFVLAAYGNRSGISGNSNITIGS